MIVFCVSVHPHLMTAVLFILGFEFKENEEKGGEARRGTSFNSHNTNQTVASDFSELLTRLNPSFCPLASLFWFIFVFLILQSCLILQTVLCLSIYLYKTKAKNNCESECTVLIHPRFFDFHGT